MMRGLYEQPMMKSALPATNNSRAMTFLPFLVDAATLLCLLIQSGPSPQARRPGVLSATSDPYSSIPAVKPAVTSTVFVVPNSAEENRLLTTTWYVPDLGKRTVLAAAATLPEK